jgi:Zn-dependent protease
MQIHWQEAIINVLLLWMLTAPHEFAHAWMATRLGDDTPRLQGRVTLNPLAHVDMIGTLLLPAVTSLLGYGFLGWGKPVYTQTSKLRGGLNGLLLVALAGPGSNVVLAVILGILAAALIPISHTVAAFLVHGVWLSLYLAIFNMLPVPPLDGSKLLLAARIPPAIYLEISRFGFVLLLVVMQATNLLQWMVEWSNRGTVAILGVLR